MRRPTAFPDVLLKVNAPFDLEKQKPSARGIRVDGFLRTALVGMPLRTKMDCVEYQLLHSVGSRQEGDSHLRNQLSDEMPCSTFECFDLCAG